MLITAQTFNEHDIQDGSNYRTGLLNASSLPGAKPIFIDQPLADSEYSGAFTVDVRNVALSVQILDYANRHALLAQLKSWFKRGTRGDLVATFQVDGLDYLLPCVVTSPPVDNGNWYFTIILQTGATAWRAVDPDEEDWLVTAAGGTHTLTVEGDDDTRLSVELTPTGLPTIGFLYQNVYQLVPPSGIALGQRPWCIQLDTAAMIAAGKMQADCDDIRLTGLYGDIKRWIADPNTNHTKIWFNVDLQIGASLMLAVAVPATGPISMLQFVPDATNQARLSTMPAIGLIYHGGEWMVYYGKDVTNCRVGVYLRAVIGTTAQAHNPGDMFSYIPAPIMMTYGNSAVTEPALADEHYDDTKPLFDLSASDNTKWVWTADSLFFDPAHTGRPGGWAPFVKRLGSVSNVYSESQNVVGGDPALGAQIGAFLAGSVWKIETADIEWKFYCAGGIKKVSMTGSKWRNGVGWPAGAGLQYQLRGAGNWSPAWSETTPGSPSSWEAWTHSAVSITDTAVWLALALIGTLPSTPSLLTMFEALTCTVEFTTANIPSSAFLGETGSYSLSVTLENTDNGDGLSVTFPMKIGKGFILDGEEFLAEYDGANAYGALQLNDPSRSAWIRLAPGANALAVSSDDVGDLTVTLAYYRRRL